MLLRDVEDEAVDRLLRRIEVALRLFLRRLLGGCALLGELLLLDGARLSLSLGELLLLFGDVLLPNREPRLHKGNARQPEANERDNEDSDDCASAAGCPCARRLARNSSRISSEGAGAALGLRSAQACASFSATPRRSSAEARSLADPLACAVVEPRVFFQPRGHRC